MTNKVETPGIEVTIKCCACHYTMLVKRIVGHHDWRQGLHCAFPEGRWCKCVGGWNKI